MAQEADARSRDRFLIRLTQAAFLYYNAVEAQKGDMAGVIRQANQFLREVKRYREDRVFYLMALRLEVDLLMHSAALQFHSAEPQARAFYLFSDEDERALSICETLLKNFPESLDPLPSTWITDKLPLYPTFKDVTLEFYKEESTEGRIPHLQKIMQQLHDELTIAAGMIRAKQFLQENDVKMNMVDRIDHELLGSIARIARDTRENLPTKITLRTDITLPRGITHSQLEAAIHYVQGQIEQSRTEKDVRRFCSHMLQLGILNFLNENNDETVRVLVHTLRATRHISPEDKKVRQYRHEDFQDIPFMMGSAFLKIAMVKNTLGEKEKLFLDKGRTALMRAVVLHRIYHQAIANLLVTLQLLGRADDIDDLTRFYLQTFAGDLNEVDGVVFRNRAFLELRNANNNLTPDIVKWMLLSKFGRGGQQSKAVKMLQELKTLYVLNAHDLSISYLQTYRSAFRVKDEEFIAELEEDSNLHSAILFYIAHAFASTALVQGKVDGELSIDHDNLDQSIDLNCEALYFNAENVSALRLVDTQMQVIQFALARTEKRWDGINMMMAQRFQFFEDYLRQEKSYSMLRDRLKDLELEHLVPELKLSQQTQNKMASVINQSQRDRIRQRVEGTAG